MAIVMIQRPKAGNALRVFLRLPAGYSRWKVLRKASDTFSGHDDADAVVAASSDAVSEPGDVSFLDADGLVNGVPYYYRPYYWVSGTWQASPTASATPAATYEDATNDVIDVLRDRLQAGLLVELQRGTLVHETGAVPVFTAPPAYDNARWPVVTLHLEDDAPAERFIGEMGGSDELSSVTDLWAEPEGYLAKVEVRVIGWSLNSDERVELRKALRRIVIANFEVFDSFGIIMPAFSQQDSEDFESFESPVYQSVGVFSCMAPVTVVSSVGRIGDVTQQIIS